MNKRFIVEGMVCTACSSSVERVVKRIPEIKEANVNLIAKTLYVEYENKKEDQITEEVISAVKKAGFSACVDMPKQAKKHKEFQETNTKETNTGPTIKTRIIVSFVFVILLMYVAMGHMIHLPLPNFVSKESSPLAFSVLQMVLAIPVLIVNRKFFINGTRGAIHLAPNMDTLISMGSSISFIYGVVNVILIATANGNEELINRCVNNLYFDSAAMILALITIGKALEEKAKSKTSNAIELLKNLVPPEITILKNGKETKTDSEDLKIGDVIVVKAGEMVPADGIIKKGNAYIDVSALTGEPIPKFVKENDNILSASINTDGYLEIETTTTIENSTLSSIIELVKNAGATKAPIQRLADKISAVFVPSVLLIALITLVVWLIISRDIGTALLYATQVLVISCPCSLGLATPVAVVASIGASAKEGILIKNAAVFEIVNKSNTVIFDKTGTVTEGKPSIESVNPLDITEEELIKIAKTLESKSNHPIAKAILAYSSDVTEYESTNHQNIAGKGLSAKIDGVEMIIGNETLFKEKEIALDRAIKSEYGTTLYISKDSKLVGTITINDKIKETSKEAIVKLKSNGIYTSLLSGDAYEPCNKVKDELGIDVAYDSVLPQDKERIVSEVEESGKTVIFVGDGINDSPALAKASVGVAIGEGTDVAINSASIIVLKNDLRDINKIIKTSKRTVKIIKENLFWAFIYNLLCIPIAAGVLSSMGINLNPMLAALAMSLSSLIVVTNALRLKKIKEV